MDGPVYARRFPSQAYLTDGSRSQDNVRLREGRWYPGRGMKAAPGHVFQCNTHTGVWGLLLQRGGGSQRTFPPSLFFYVPTSWHFVNVTFSSSVFHLHVNLFSAFLASAVSVKVMSESRM